MKSNDLQNVVLGLHEQGLNSRQISNQVAGQLSKTTVNEWVKRYREYGELNLQFPSGPKPTKRTKRLVQQVKQRLLRSNGRKSARKLAKSFNVSRTTMRRVIKNDMGFRSYVKRIASKLTDTQKSKRYSSGIWIRKNIRKSNARKILFSDEKRIDIDGVYNRQNDRIYAPSRQEVDNNGGVHGKSKYLQGVMVWLGVCYNGVTRPVIIEDGTINHQKVHKKNIASSIKRWSKAYGRRIYISARWSISAQGPTFTNLVQRSFLGFLTEIKMAAEFA